MLVHVHAFTFLKPKKQSPNIQQKNKLLRGETKSYTAIKTPFSFTVP